jgi:hypothetical protein
MTQVFVSYAGRDAKVALPVIEAIGQAGFSVSSRITAGLDLGMAGFIERLQRELETAQCVVVLWSAAAGQSDMVREEIRHAIQAWSSDRLVLAMLDDAPLPVGLSDEVRYFVSGFPRIPIATIDPQQLRSQIAQLQCEERGTEHC